MNVEKVFWQDSYLTKLEVVITSIADDTITLDRTIGYAFSGGQCSDRITISGYQVLEAVKDGFQIYYKMPHNHHLNVNDCVDMEIDWPYRYRVMKLHFAAECVLELVYSLDSNIEKIGANITDSKARVDFLCAYPISDALELLQSKIDSMIAADYVIETGYTDEKLQRRFWSIENLYHVPCGGTHVKRSSELGKVKLKRVNLGKSKERIEITLV